MTPKDIPLPEPDLDGFDYGLEKGTGLFTDDTVRTHREEYAWARCAELEALLLRALPIIRADAQMMADIARHSPLDPASQAAHDATVYDSERLVYEIPAAIAARTEVNP